MTNDVTPTPENSAPVPEIPKGLNLRRKIVAFGSLPIYLIAAFIATIPTLFFIQNPQGVLNGEAPEISIAILVTSSLLAGLLAIVAGVALAGLWPLRKHLYLGLKRWWHVLLGLGIGVVSYGILQAVAIAAQSLTGETVDNSDTSNQLAGLTGVGGALFLILVVGILAPTVEEFFFRGVIIGSLQGSNWNKPWIAIVTSAVFFGAAHYQGLSTVTDILILVWITIMGGIFASLVLWTKSLWPAVAAHIGYNMITSIAIISLGAGA